SRNLEAEIVDKQAVAKALADILELDHLVAQALGNRNKDFLRFIALLVFVRRQFFKAGQARLGLGLAALGILAHPLKLFLDGALACRLGSLFLLQAVVLLLEPGTVIALPGYAVAAIQLKYPLGCIVQKIAVVRHRNDSSRELA